MAAHGKSNMLGVSEQNANSMNCDSNDIPYRLNLKCMPFNTMAKSMMMMVSMLSIKESIRCSIIFYILVCPKCQSVPVLTTFAGLPAAMQ